MCRHVTRYALFCLSTEKSIDRLLERLSHEIPEREIDAADRHRRHSSQPIGHGGAVHLIPYHLDVERILADQKPAEMLLDHTAGERAPAVVDSATDNPFVSKNLDRKSTRLNSSHANISY